MRGLENKSVLVTGGASGIERAAAIQFLASDEAPYITGQHIVIDGGEIAGGLASR